MSTNASTRDEIDLSLVVLVLGAVLLVGGFIAYFYEERSYWSVTYPYPYRDIAVPLLVLGVVLIIAGAFLRTYTSRKA